MEKRTFERSDCRLSMRIYTSIKSGAYSVDIHNISCGGAYVSSRHLPTEHEVISFELADHSFKPIYFGNAKVVRCSGNDGKKGSGFGIQFDRPIEPKILDRIAQ